MKLEQLSIFLENKAGRLAEVTRVLAAGSINILALSLADTSEFGILRMIVDQNDKAKAILTENGFSATLTNVVAVEVPHKPGGLNAILQVMSAHGVIIEYMYAFWQKGEFAIMIFRFDDVDKALRILKDAGMSALASSQVFRD